MPRILWVLLALMAWGTARATPIAEARRTDEEAPSAAELAAEARLEHARCGVAVGLLWPGIGQVCANRDREAAFLGTLGLVEAGVGGVLLVTDELPPPADPTRPQAGRQVTLVALQDLWVYSVARHAVDVQLSRHKRYAPPDELRGMLGAPFDPRVLKRPAVTGGILALSAAGTALQVALAAPVTLGGRPNVFGAHPPAALGYTELAVLHGALMSHVAVAEEIAFRGLIQSGLARPWGETGGWIGGTLVFGPFHALNALVLPEEERIPYLVYAVPWITVTGSWLGLVYRWGGYSLTGPIAVHWWYNMLVSASALAIDPENNLFSARIQARW